MVLRQLRNKCVQLQFNWRINEQQTVHTLYFAMLFLWKWMRNIDIISSKINKFWTDIKMKNNKYNCSLSNLLSGKFTLITEIFELSSLSDAKDSLSLNYHSVVNFALNNMRQIWTKFSTGWISQFRSRLIFYQKEYYQLSDKMYLKPINLN